MKQIDTENTRKRNIGILDLVLTIIPNQINRRKVKSGISDHDGIRFVEVLLNTHKKKVAPRTGHVYRRVDCTCLNMFPSTELENVHQQKTVEIWSFFRGDNRGIINKVHTAEEV